MSLSLSQRLKELGEIMAKAPKGSAKYKAATKELDKLLGMPEDIQREKEVESLDDEDAVPEND